jgi:hypothetical protein
MLYRFSPLVAVAAATLVLACSDRTPTGPTALTANIQDNTLAKRKHAQLTGAINQTIGVNHIEGTIQITRFDYDEAAGLLVSGVISGAANGVEFEQAFSQIPATLGGGRDSDAAAAPVSSTATVVGDLVVKPVQTMAIRCDILNLDLGPLNLNVLGLVVDLQEVVLDVFAETGAGNLLGNLLCAVVGLLDGPGILASIGQILEQINTILGAL